MPTIGVLAGWQFYRTATNLSYLAPVFRGMRRAAQDLGCNLLLGCGIGPSANPGDPLRPAWPFLSPEHDFVPVGPANTDGLIIASPLHSRARSNYVQSLLAARHPILFIGSGELGPAIVADNTGGILDAMRHLIQHGHQQIAFIAGTREDMGGDSGDRLRAYQYACQLYGLDKNPLLVAYGRHVYDGGYTAMQQIINSGAGFTAVLASNDESALGAMQALKDAGWSIPKDAAVIGFDNRLDGAVHEPALSSIHVPLFNIGYRAVDLLLQHIGGKLELTGTVKVDTRLVLRESCGCGVKAFLDQGHEATSISQPLDPGKLKERLVKAIAPTVMNQTYWLTEDESFSFCQRLAETFAAGLQDGDSTAFRKTLDDVLRSTAASDENLHMWQDALSILSQELAGTLAQSASTVLPDFINDARLAISAQMQRQHQQYVVNERWVSSRLSLLTSGLLSVLDEAQTYAILARHLPDMGIHFAMLGLFEAQGSDPVGLSVLRDLVHPEQALIRYETHDFPPAALARQNIPPTLTIIPLVDQSGQTGFMVFGSEHLDLYGAVVQQVAGALNTARLYRQATEGRRLAEEANRMKSRFLSTISHELRTPLNLILGVSRILLEEGDEDRSALPDAVQRDIERIHAYAQHLGGLIGDVLDLATSDAGQLRLNMELMDLGEALRMVLESGRQLTADKGLEWRAAIPEASFWVWGDRTRLRQVVLNFINNAIKFTTHGEISLNVELGENTVTVRLHDTGLGIPADEQALIFDEFRRSERSISLGYPGLGLGLAICKMLIEMHNGTIGVQSSGIEGEGSTFYFTLPTVPPPDGYGQPAIKMPAAEPTVLVLSNRTGTSSRLCDLLNQRGIKVQTALIERTPEWQSILAKSPPDAIVLDVSVESDLAWRILKTIQGSQLARMIPVMFYTSSPDGESLLNLDYLTKPIEMTELTQALDHHFLLAGPDHPVHTFLVVDDEPDTLELHVRIVQSRSASNRVLKARNGREALNHLRQEKIDLVLLDLQMPEMDGFEVLQAMHENESTRGIPVIVVTGKVLSEPDMARLNQGVAAVLKKGMFGMEETMAHISAALERKRKLSLDAQRLVRQAMAFLHEHYAEPISRRDIAQHINITEDYLTFCFRQELGITPIKYLQRFRVHQAKQLLKTSHKSITEIALEVGFSDGGYFSRIFHRETGMSPEAYRLS